MKGGFWVPYGLLILATLWFLLVVSGVLGGWAKDLAAHLPASLVLTAALSIPVLAALCSLRLRIDWRVRIVLLLVLLTCVPLLSISFERQPVVAATVAMIFVAEEFAIIPLINRRLIRPN